MNLLIASGIHLDNDQNFPDQDSHKIWNEILEISVKKEHAVDIVLVAGTLYRSMICKTGQTLKEKVRILNADGSQKKIKPALLKFKKKNVNIALYGLNQIEDSKVDELIREKKIDFDLPPVIRSENAMEMQWFKILVLFQRRQQDDDNENQGLQESSLPPWMDLVVWGGGKECHFHKKYSFRGDFEFIEPGNTVVTDHKTTKESGPKSVGILTVARHDNSNEPYRSRIKRCPLENSREVYTIDMHLNNVELKTQSGSELALDRCMHKMDNQLNIDGGNRRRLLKPYVHLNLHCKGSLGLFGIHRLREKYNGLVENYRDMVKIHFTGNDHSKLSLRGRRNKQMVRYKFKQDEKSPTERLMEDQNTGTSSRDRVSSQEDNSKKPTDGRVLPPLVNKDLISNTHPTLSAVLVKDINVQSVVTTEQPTAATETATNIATSSTSTVDNVEENDKSDPVAGSPTAENITKSTYVEATPSKSEGKPLSTPKSGWKDIFNMSPNNFNPNIKKKDIKNTYNTPKSGHKEKFSESQRKRQLELDNFDANEIDAARRKLDFDKKLKCGSVLEGSVDSTKEVGGKGKGKGKGKRSKQQLTENTTPEK